MLTSKQRAWLRKLAAVYDTIFQVGKGGVTDNMCEQISNALEARELIKLRTLDNSDYGANDAAEEIAERVNAEVVQVIGTRFVLYRESVDHKRIDIENMKLLEPKTAQPTKPTKPFPSKTVPQPPKRK